MLRWLFAILLSFFLMVSPAIPQQTWYRIPADVAACSAAPLLTFCHPGQRGHLLSLTEIIFVDIIARAHFTYQSDSELIDTWESHAGDVIQQRPWSGDCDDLALTTADLLLLSNADSSHVWRLLVNSQGHSYYDHIVTIVRDEDGHDWVVGDTFAPIYPLSEMRHRPLYISKASFGARWQTISFNTQGQLNLP